MANTYLFKLFSPSDDTHDSQKEPENKHTKIENIVQKYSFNNFLYINLFKLV